MKRFLGSTMKRLPIFLVLALGACSAMQSTEKAEGAVTRFHTVYDQGQFAQMYSAADPALREASSEKDFLELMQAVRRKMGKVKSTKRTGAGINVSTSGTRVSMAYQTEFEAGSGVEQFVWLMHGDSARLAGYNINSPTLVVK